MIYNRPESIITTTDDYVREFGSEEEARRRLFNIGSGTWSHECWSNLDLPAQSPEFAAIQAPCIPHDLVSQSSLPIPSDSVQVFYCSHVVEHLPYWAVVNLMREAVRCLRPGGVLRIVTGPCADLDWHALLRNDSRWWFWELGGNVSRTACGSAGAGAGSIYDRWLHHIATPRSPLSLTPCERKYGGEEIRELVDAHRSRPQALWNLLTESLPFDSHSPGDHISWWNFDRLSQTLLEAGFGSVRRSGYGQSSVLLMRDLRHFDQTYPQISVYIEAVR
jgi:hypothetical protein